jgi:manganese/zinc/iron transport system permease protein
MIDLLQNVSDDVWVLLIACLVGISCSLVGVFLVLRRMSMLGDAISHSVLFGIVAGFLLTGSRSVLVMTISAAAVGLLTAFITSALNKFGKLQEDASIGVTFTWLFAMGVILISAFAGAVDLDQDCVLYGEIAFAPFDRIYVDSIDFGPRAFWFIAGICVLTLIYIVSSFRRLKLICFDPILASSLGISMGVWHYGLMTNVSLVTVASFDAVGAILVVALLAVPANTAFLFCKSLLSMLCFSCLFAVLSAVSGFYLAAYFDASISAAMGVMSGVLFLLVLVIVKWQESQGVSLVGTDNSTV